MFILALWEAEFSKAARQCALCCRARFKRGAQAAPFLSRSVFKPVERPLRDGRNFFSPRRIQHLRFLCVHRQTERRVRVLTPSPELWWRVALRARSAQVKCYEDNTHVKAAVESPERVSVMVGMAVRRCAVRVGGTWRRLLRATLGGVVVDGCVRDVQS